MSRWIESLWYRLSPWHILLWPLSQLYGAVIFLRRQLYRRGFFKTEKISVPVIIVGNITVGGSGKTPLVIWLAEYLRGKGFVPGVISRGYGGNASIPTAVNAQSGADETGDEPLLIFRRTSCPVVVGRDRVAAAKYLLQKNSQVNIIISDDGLQHYRLARDVEICVVDGARAFGNGLLIPAGPLRESVSRLQSIDALVMNGSSKNYSIKSNSYNHFMNLLGEEFFNLKNPRQRATAKDFTGKKIHALAGIGHPARFFSHLKSLGLQIAEHGFADHHQFKPSDLELKPSDLAFENEQVILMTEKDAVKCESFATENCWVLAVSAELDAAFGEAVLKKLGASHGPQTA